MNPKSRYKRILLKLSGEFLSSGAETVIDAGATGRIIEEIQPLVRSGLQTGIVLGAGNIFRGNPERQKEKSGNIFTQVQADKAGMLATVINSLLLSDLLSSRKIKNRLFSTIHIDSLEFFNAVKAVDSLEQGYVNIYAGGTSNPFVTTDTAAVLKAVETGCDILVKATKVDGVYDKDPVRHRDARLFREISDLEVIEKKLKVMDLTAMSLAMENKMPVAVIDFTKKGNLAGFLAGKASGTIISGS